MKILLLGPIHREREYLLQKEKLPFLKGQGQQSWVEAFERLGHQVSVFRYTDSIVFPDKIRLFSTSFFQQVMPRWYSRYRRLKDAYYYFSFENSLRSYKLLEHAKNFQPDFVVLSGGINNVFPHAIRSIKNLYGTKIFLFAGVNPKISATSLEKTLIEEGVIDCVVENDRGYAKLWEKMGAKKTVVLPISSVDPKLHRKIRLTQEEEEEFGCDVCFVGSLTKERQEILRLAQNDKYTRKIWGDIPIGLKLDKDLVSHYYGEAFGEKMVKIFNAARIILNFQPKDMTHGGNMRTFEIPGCGGFQLVDRVDSDWFTVGKELVLFKSGNDLLKKIEFYLEHTKERKMIAERGYNRAHKAHAYDKHFEKLFSLL